MIHRLLPAGLVLVTLLFARALPAAPAGVEAREQTIVLPTYEAGPPEPSPMFDFGQDSQGAAGKIYPYPLYDVLTHRKVDRTYKLLVLENEYVRIGILPEIGGRIFEGVDKTNGYPFFYRQHVIKPALIGLIGAWISGGVEWNIPHHHRASTFLPVQYGVESKADGTKVVWVGELEVRHRMRWAVGYSLRPGSSVVEAEVRIFNRTPLPQSMLCFANVAVHVNDDYQVIFPPRTQYVTFHGKREFTTWPIARGRYAGADYGEGTDVSYFKNHQNATSMFAWNDTDDFFAGYDHGQQAGTMSVADHRYVPGKKLWTWGNGPRGRMWDKILTDADGPYIELMVGAYSDNQPDYSWIEPYETRVFPMHWYPFRDIGGVKLANLDAAVNLDVVRDGKTAAFGFHATRAYPNATARLSAGDRVLKEQTISIDPGHPYRAEVELPEGTDPHSLRAALLVEDRELVAYTPVAPDDVPLPAPVELTPPPAQVATVEELLLAGQRIEQFHSPNQDPEPYWLEALKRDPKDARTNVALGQKRLKQSRYAEAESHFRTALERLTRNYTSPRDGEAHYGLGLALEGQGRDDEADRAFTRATWTDAWKGAAEVGLARIAMRRGDFAAVADHLDRALSTRSRSSYLVNLKSAAWRHLDRTHPNPKGNDLTNTVEAQLKQAQSVGDFLNVGTMAERWLLTGENPTSLGLVPNLVKHPATALETATGLDHIGLSGDALALLKLMDQSLPPGEAPPAMALYHMADLAARLGLAEAARRYQLRAQTAPVDVVFPFQAEQIGILERAMKADPADARAPYHLGNLLFDWQPDRAIALWEQSVELDGSFPMAWRNLALAHAKRPGNVNDLPKAIACIERAVAAESPFPLHFAELDELYEATGKHPDERLEAMEKRHDVVNRRDDSLAREISLLVTVGRYDDAIRLLTGREFAVWEGGVLHVADDWTEAQIRRGAALYEQGDFQKALAAFEAGANVPQNLPTEAVGENPRRAELGYRSALVLEALGQKVQAQARMAEVVEPAVSTSERGFREQLPQNALELYHQALALLKLGRDTESRALLERLVEAGTSGRTDRTEVPVDPAAPASAHLARRHAMARLHFAVALGHAGLDQTEQALEELAKCLEARPDLSPARALALELKQEKPPTDVNAPPE